MALKNRNAEMAKQIEAVRPEYPFSFIIIGDTGASPNPAGDAIFTEMLNQIEKLVPKPSFIVNLGDFAGPGTMERHERYLRMVEKLSIPNICIRGNHEQDDPAGVESYSKIYGPVNFHFAYGNTSFVAINSQWRSEGPTREDLAYLDEHLGAGDYANRIVLMHMPPSFNGHYATAVEWGFTKFEDEFLAIVKKHNVKLVCCAHILGYDYYEHDGIGYVISGGGGWGLFCDYGLAQGAPPNRGGIYHFVKISLQETGAITGEVIRAFEGTKCDVNFGFLK